MTIHDDDTPLYRRSGVSIGAGDALVARLKSMVRSTHRKEVVAGVGGFGALFSVPKHYQEPVLVSGTDGVGTKLKVAFALDGHDSIGTDLVAMSVNDILAQGAEPLFFLDYFACGQLDMEIAARVVGGMVRGCEQAGCSLIGGETAEMPGMYPPGEYDIAGFAVGVVEKAAVIDGAAVQPGDSVIGLASNGLHANGYSLVRKIVEQHWGPLDLLWAQQTVPWAGGLSWREVLLVPTRIYVKSIRTLLQVLPVKAMAHITGGGLIGNLPRMLDKSLGVGLHRGSWPMLEVVSWLVDKAGMSDAERYRVFNCGIGMAVVVSSQRVAEAVDCLAQCGEAAYVIGEIVSAATQFDPLKKEGGDRVVLL